MLVAALAAFLCLFFFGLKNIGTGSPSRRVPFLPVPMVNDLEFVMTMMVRW